jgi:glycine/sarcosine N-methyltransferase
MSGPGDPYSRVDYRRLIAWPERLRREEPFLREVLGSGPNRRVLDLGCGTGEHSRFLATAGFEVTGVDASAEMLAAARDGVAGGNPRFVEGDLREIEAVVGEGFGAALCLGNTVPHLADPAALQSFLRGLARRLRPGAPFLLQVLNYDRIFERHERVLPVNVRTDEGDPVVFLRLMDPRPDGSVVFNPTALRWRPGGDPPVAVMASHNVLLRGYRKAELVAALADAGFGEPDLWGGMMREPWTPDARDTVLVAERRRIPER